MAGRKHGNPTNSPARFACHEVLNFFLAAVNFYLNAGNKKMAAGFLYFLKVVGLGDDPRWADMKKKVDAMGKGRWVKKG